MRPTNDDMVLETLERSRRIETQLIRMATSMGIDTRTHKPEWFDQGTIRVKSPMTSMRDLLETIPRDWNLERPVHVFLPDGTLLCKITPGDMSPKPKEPRQ